MYPDLVLPTLPNRPFFYTNFVSTVDGKIQVATADQLQYWPIGSKTDYQTLLELRAHADVLIYGKNTALAFNHGEKLALEEFKKARETNKKDPNLLYLVVCSTLEKKALEILDGPHAKHTYLVMPESSTIDPEVERTLKVIRIGKERVDVKLLSSWLHNQKYQHVLVEGGPTLVGAFFKERLIDEVFLTIAPKIFGNTPGKTLTLLEGHLFPPQKIPQLEIISLKQVENELFLRYTVIHP